MTKTDVKYPADGKEFLRLRLMDGTCYMVKKKKIAGYCHHNAHQGYLTVALLEKHDCIKKQCRCLEKFEEYPFWDNYNRQAKAKARKKEEIKRLQQSRKAHDSDLESRMRALEQAAQRIADRLEYPIIITRITPKKDAGNNYEYILNYVSDDMGSRWSDYFDLAIFMGKSHGGKYILRPLRKPDGSLASVSDWINRRNN